MADSSGPACMPFPEVPEIPEVTLPGGAKMQGFLDFSQGMPSECTVTFSLLVQLMPLLGSMTCLFKVLAVMKALEGFVTSGNPTKVLEAGPAMADLAGCFLSLQPPGIALTVVGVLKVVIKFLKCFTKQLKSIVDFQAKIDLSAAEGNPALQASLGCAQDNAKTSIDQLMASLGPVQPLMDVITDIADIAGLPLALPSMSDISEQEDLTEVIAKVDETITSLDDVISSLPG
jgi:hypothetical protein